MATNEQIDRALATIAAVLNDRGMDGFDAGTVQRIISETLDGQLALSVDGGGGLHDEAGIRIGAVRRTDSGEWITEPQNPAAEHADAVIPREPPWAKLRKLLTELKVRG